MKPQYLNPTPQGGHRDRWMISYVDVLTILLVFFIAAASRSLGAHDTTPPPVPASVPHVENAANPASVSQSTPPANPATPDASPATAAASTQPVKPASPPPRSPLEGALDTLKSEGIEAKLETRGLMISLPQTILYASGDDRVSASAMPVVAQIAEILKGLPNHVDLIGHADSSPIHTARFKNNWELSAARGLRLLELLNAKYGIEEPRLSVSSDGSNTPLESNDTPEGRALNRRVEILILN